MKTFHLDILTPFGKYFSSEVSYLRVQSSEYRLGILPDHAPLISTLAVSEMEIRIGDYQEFFAIGGGIIRVENNHVTLLLDSIERKQEIDITRAYKAKERAENRLKSNLDEENKKRAELSLKRALNRIAIYERNR